MPATIQNELGKIVLSDEVVATIVGLATVENYGIIGMASKNASDGLWKLLGRDNIRQGVVVALTDDQAMIDLYVMVEYGVSINAVAENIIHNVVYRVRESTGLTIDSVKVHVQGVRVQAT